MSRRKADDDFAAQIAGELGGLDDIIDGRASGNGFKAFTFADFLALKVRERPYLLEPILRERDLAMVVAWRGVGKTFFSHGVALAVALGGRFLRWSAPQPTEVLVVDGEMPTGALQERLLTAVNGFSDSLDPAEIPLRLIPADAYENPLPSLSTAEGQSVVERHIGDARLLILDNISTLLEIGNENEAESWAAAQSWLLYLRRNGIAVLLVHHEGKTGSQRGTSRREDILDLSLSLKRPPGYKQSDGARFEVVFEKARHLSGPDADSFEARLDIDADQRQIWTMSDPAEAKRQRAMELLELRGMSIRDVAHELGVPKSTVAYWKKQGDSLDTHIEQVAERLRGEKKANGSERARMEGT